MPMSWSSPIPITELTLVRHGQASYLEGDDYDRLSTIGERQARRLGHYWREHGVRFDLIFSGPAKRHRGTAELVAEVMTGSNLPWPPVTTLPEFDEFPGEAVVRRLGPLLAARHRHIQEMTDAFNSALDKLARKQALDILFPEVASRWVDAEVHVPGVETWKDFVARVSRGVERIREVAAPGSRVVVFTSAGPTAVVTSLALSIPPRKTLALAFSPRNGSYSEFRLRPGSIGLNTFNSFPHLDDPALLTYR